MTQEGELTSLKIDPYHSCAAHAQYLTPQFHELGHEENT